MSERPVLAYAKLVDDYLNEAHRDHPGTGCAINALVGVSSIVFFWRMK